MTRLGLGLAAALCGAGLLAGCTGTPGVSSSGDQGYVSGDGSFKVVKVADRKTPSAVEGPSLTTGRRLSLAALRGKIVVVNVWGSWCTECQVEAAGLSAAARELKPRGVAFLGITSRDHEQASPRAYQRKFKVPYESIFDPDGTTLLAFHDSLPPKSTPSTLIIDRQGRVAAVVLGPVTKRTLTGLVQDVSRGRST